MASGRLEVWQLVLGCMLLQLCHSQSQGSSSSSSSSDPHGALGRGLHQSDVSMPKFPWQYKELPGTQRWWDEALLSAASTHTNYRQLDNVLYRLINKKGIVVLLLGSSVVADYGGCWPRHDHSQTKSLVQEPGIVYMANLCERFGQGWGAAFMEALDKAFPGNNNVIVNAGRNALPLYGIMQIGCLEAHLPKDRRPDLVIVENHEPSIEGVNASWYTERIIWRILAHPFGPPLGPPAFPSGGASAASGGSNPASASSAATGGLGGLTQQEALSVVPAVVFLNVINAPRPACLNSSCASGTVEDEIAQLLTYYGFGAVSTRQFLRETAKRAFATQPASAREEMIKKSESVLVDHVHPTVLGKVMMADVLLQHLFDALRSLTASGRAGAGASGVARAGRALTAASRAAGQDQQLGAGKGKVGGRHKGAGESGRGHGNVKRRGGQEGQGPKQQRRRRRKGAPEQGGLVDTTSVQQGMRMGAGGEQGKRTAHLQQGQGRLRKQGQRGQQQQQRRRKLRPQQQVLGGTSNGPLVTQHEQQQQQVLGGASNGPLAAQHALPPQQQQQPRQLLEQPSSQAGPQGLQQYGWRRHLHQLSGLWDRPPVPRSMPAQAFSPGGRDLWSMRCYGHLVDGHNFHDTKLGNLNIVANQGFEYSEYQVHGSKRKFKPGWIATQPNSRLVFRVDSAFIASGTQSWTQAKALVSLLMLWSYEHMGRAKLSCVSGCTCNPTLVDFHEKKDRYSLLKDHSFEVSQHPQCEVELLVLPETSSGEHKVKLVQVVAKVPVGNQATA